MREYAEVNRALGTVLRTRVMPDLERDDGGNAVWIPLSRDAFPPYDNALSYLEQTATIGQDGVTFGWVVRDFPVVPPSDPPVPGTTPPRLVASAFGVTPIPENYDITLEGPFNFTGAMYFDVGLYLIGFVTLQEDTNYFVLVSDGITRTVAVEKGLDFILLQAVDSGGVPVDPSSFNIEVYRV